MRDFKKYSELNSSLLVAEKNNELLIKNYQFCPTGSAAFPKSNASSSKNYEREYNHDHDREYGRGHGCGHD